MMPVVVEQDAMAYLKEKDRRVLTVEVRKSGGG